MGWWDTLSGVTNQKIVPYGVPVNESTDRLLDLAAQYQAAPLYAPLAAEAAGARANRDALSRAAAARGPSSALMIREAEYMNEGRDRQMAADAAAAAGMEQAQRFSTIGDILTGAGNLELGGQGLNAGSYNVAQQLKADQEQRNADRQQEFYAGLINTGGAVAGSAIASGSGDPSVDARTGAASGQAASDASANAAPTVPRLDLPSDVLGKEDIAPMSPEDQAILDELAAAEAAGTIDTQNHGYVEPATDPALEQALLADLYAEEADERREERPLGADTAAARETGLAVGRQRAATAGRDKGTSGMGAAIGGTIGGIAGSYFGPAGTAAGAWAGRAAGDAIESDRRAKTQVEPYMYSDKLTKEQIELLDMATQPAANRQNLGPLDGYTYRYKPKVAAAIGEDTGLRPGIMAQDMERAPVGESVVKETGNGKALDVNRALGFSLAGLAGLDKRMKTLELDQQRIDPPEGVDEDRMELGFDEKSGIWREQGSTIGEGPTDPAYDNPANYEPMELGFDEADGIWRAIGSVKGESNDERIARERSRRRPEARP